jgi:hypothetical protein
VTTHPFTYPSIYRPIHTPRGHEICTRKNRRWHENDGYENKVILRLVRRLFHQSRVVHVRLGGTHVRRNTQNAFNGHVLTSNTERCGQRLETLPRIREVAGSNLGYPDLHHSVPCKPVTRQRPRNKHVPISTNPHTTVVELLEKVFSTRSVTRGCITRTPAEQ